MHDVTMAADCKQTGASGRSFLSRLLYFIFRNAESVTQPVNFPFHPVCSNLRFTMNSSQI